jgi:hypothetical protein
VLVETYPRVYYSCIEPVSGAKSVWSKRAQSDLLKRIPRLLDWAASLGIDRDPDVLTRVKDGFSAESDGEDEFDAVVGLIAMLGAPRGVMPIREPDREFVRTVEGWILGRVQDFDVGRPTRVPTPEGTQPGR